MAPPPLLGFNNNVRHRGRVFHIQTEDSGVQHPRVVTHLFADGGRIVKTTRTDYAEHVGRDDMAEVVRRMMKEQHKAMFVALRAGELDTLIENACGPLEPLPTPSQRSAPESLPLSQTMAAVSTSAVAEDAPPPSTAAPSSAGRQRLLSNPNLRRVSQPPPALAAGTPAQGTPMVAHPSGQHSAVRPEGADQTGRYAASRPATIFADAPSPSAASIFGDALLSEKSLDDVIRSYLSEEEKEPGDAGG